MPENDPNLMTIFAEALERTDPAARAAYLDGACGDDAALCRRIEALLAAHDGAGRFLEGDPTGTSEPTARETLGATRASDAETILPSGLATSVYRPDSTFAGTPQADRPRGLVAGQVIAGRYTLLEVLGEGGMGTVYRAGQTEPVKRQVALKLIKIGMDSRAVLARFDAERQALALMDHPNIARVYDGGTTAAGQPFFVMELVSGVPITEYCDRERISVRARLELFVSVCQAVQHAHQKGIIHRDLKPGNVLVTEVDGRPTPKVIDFGVAKATEFKLTDQSLADAGAIVGTPTYMSPEQADPSSMDIDTRTDVYALGVILYELLAGSPPIDAKQFKHGAILEMLLMVLEIEPPSPSTRVSTAEALPSIAASRGIEPEQLKRALRGDLDWIVMKALEKDRARRYETANGFAADVLRHLAYEPVLAAPPSRAYRLRRFVRKHRAAVVAVSLVVLALVGGIAGTTWGLIRADIRRAEAERARAAEAERVKERDEAVKVSDARADELKYRLGISEFLLASEAYKDGDVILAADRLDKVPPAQRCWEWSYLKRLTRGGLFTLYGHTDHVTEAKFSPDGSRIVTGSADRTARVWDARTGTNLLELKGHHGKVVSATFSPDGTRVVTGSLDRTAKIWDAKSGTLVLDLKGHTSPLSGAAFSRDGSRIVTGSWDSTARVWDARAGTTLLELKGHTGAVLSAAFSPDGSRIVTSGNFGLAKVWDARAGTTLLELKGGNIGQVWSATFSPDGLRIVTGGLDRTVRVWDAQAGTLLLELKGHTYIVNSAMFSPDGSRIMTASDDRTARVWDSRSGTLLLELKGHTGEVTSASFSPDGERVVTCSWDRTVKIWDARTETAPLVLKGQRSAVWSASFSPDGARIVTASRSYERTARVWDARSGMTLLELRGHSNDLLSAAFSPDGMRIVTCGGDRTAKVWDARSGTTLIVLRAQVGDMESAAFSPDGTRIVTGGGSRNRPGEAKVWDARTGNPLLELKGHTGAVLSAAFSPHGSRIVTGSVDRTARVWDARSGTTLLELKGHTGAVQSATFSPDGTRIVTGGVDPMAKVWDARNGALLLDMRGPNQDVKSATFSPDGLRIVTSGGGPGIQLGHATVWDAQTGTPLFELKGHTLRLASAAFSQDGSRIVTGSWDRTARVWDARAEPTLRELKGHTGEVRSATLSPDGSRIVTGSNDSTARIWGAQTGTTVLELKGHKGEVVSATFSPDGTRVVTGSSDGTARIWDALTGMTVLELKGHTDGVVSAAFSPDGTRVVTGSNDSMAKVWDAQSGTLVLDLKGHTRPLSGAAFSRDGARIATEDQFPTAKVWDARTGQELKGEPIPSAPGPPQISFDGRSIAHPAGSRVELVPLNPDAEELAHRRLQTRPNVQRYRDSYDAAIKSKDDFAARFYLNLFPPPEQALIKAEAIVAPLFDRLYLREDVVAALQAQPDRDPEVQTACLKLAESWPEYSDLCNEVGWGLVRAPGLPQANYRRGLRLAWAACRQEPESSLYLNTLGVAQYRTGLFVEALASLTRSNDLNNQKEPGDLAFLALAQHRLGHSEKARDTLGRLRELMKDPAQAKYEEAQALLREAETIELDQAFPADPFAP
jgi:eukaryotic-like serine/threonine-protein kinase